VTTLGYICEELRLGNFNISPDVSGQILTSLVLGLNEQN
jgi:hypothetical protein